MTRRAVLAALFAAPTQAWAQGDRPRTVMATFSILADLCRQMAGRRIRVEPLVGPDADAHHFEPKPVHLRTLAEADVFVTLGLGFDPWSRRLIESSGFRGPSLETGSVATPLSAGRSVDPHIWHDVASARAVVALLAKTFANLDPADADGWRTRAAGYDARLRALDLELRRRFAAIPEARRVIVSSHGAFGYLGRAYGFRVLAARGLTTAREPSAAELGALVRLVRAEAIPALFFEGPVDDRLIRRVEAETGARVGGRLFSDALGPPGGPASDYIGLMRTNARTIAAALAPPP